MVLSSHPLIQPTCALSSGQCLGGLLQQGVDADLLSGTQSCLSQGIYALKV